MVLAAEQQKRISEEREKAQQRGKRSNIDFASSKSATQQGLGAIDAYNSMRDQYKQQDARRGDRDYDRWDSKSSNAAKSRHRERSRSPRRR